MAIASDSQPLLAWLMTNASGQALPSLRDILHRPAWMDHGACGGAADPDLFFPERGASTREAKALCATCTVRADCLDYAVRDKDLHGIWGGTSDKERRLLRRTVA